VRFCPYNPPYKPGGEISTPLFLEDENIFQKSASVGERGIAVEVQPRRPIFGKMFSSSRKRGSADAFENDPSFRSKGTVRARGRIIFLFFPRAAHTRAENQANRQYNFKSSRWRMELLDTDSCRRTVPMKTPMSNSSMRHPDPDLDFDDTRIILQGASCTITAQDNLYIYKLRY
jgi:hypothetical protein